MGVEFDKFFIDVGYSLSDMSFANVFSHSVGSLLVLLIVSFAVQMFFKFFLMFIYFLRETECEQGRGRERETQNLKQVSRSELSAQGPM